MDARALLEAVAEAYATLNSFEVEIQSTTESGDADSLDRTSRRARAFFVAPDKVRIEESGRNGTVTVTDGIVHHHYFRRPKQYSWGEVHPGSRLAGSFCPEFPFSGGTIFLFHRIAERVASAEILREEPEAHVISVTYDPAEHLGFAMSTSPLTLWIDRRTRLVLRVQGEVTHQLPDRESHTGRIVYAYEHAFLNQSIPPQTFEYVPPADSVDQAQMPPRGGCGTSYNGPDEKKRFAAWHTNRWAGEAFEEEFELTIRDIDLRFERRLSFADKDLRISERIIGPQGPAEHEFSIPLA